MNNNTKEIHLTVLSQAPFNSFGDIFDRGMEKSTSTLGRIGDKLYIDTNSFWYIEEVSKVYINIISNNEELK